MRLSVFGAIALCMACEAAPAPDSAPTGLMSASGRDATANAIANKEWFGTPGPHPDYSEQIKQCAERPEASCKTEVCLWYKSECKYIGFGGYACADCGQDDARTAKLETAQRGAAVATVTA